MLVDLIKMSEKTIIKKICSSANLHGENAWLWLPEEDCKNKRVCLVAHIDTVHPTPSQVFFDQKKGVYFSPTGLGADDRAGVYACLKLRQQFGGMVLFTDKEERGGAGAKEASKIFSEEFKNIDCFIELDRAGRKDMVFYNGESAEFKRFIGSFGFAESFGTFSDISILSAELGIVGANLSIGYYRQHSQGEFLRVSEMEFTIRKLANLFKNCPAYDVKKWHISERSISSYYDKRYDWDIPMRSRSRSGGVYYHHPHDHRARQTSYDHQARQTDYEIDERLAILQAEADGEILDADNFKFNQAEREMLFDYYHRDMFI